VLIFAHFSSLLMLSSHDSCMPIMWQVLSHMLQLTATTMSFQNRRSLSFSDSFTRTISEHNNVLTRALQTVKQLKNIQCCQLKFFQCSQHELLINFLILPLIYPHMVWWTAIKGRVSVNSSRK
jgi:hypothetical protein